MSALIIAALVYMISILQGPPTGLIVPEGFHVAVYAEVENARAMTLDEDGTVYVGSRGAGKIYALKDIDKDGVAENVIVIDKNLDSPVGVSYFGGDLYVSAMNKIYKYADIREKQQDAERSIINKSFPDDRHHGWKFIDFGPDSLLYVPVGAPCNICEADTSRYANIMRMKADGSELEVYALGVRNTVGFSWHPETQELWFTDNGRDWMGDDFPPCELNQAKEIGQHFGYPYCHGKSISDPEFGSKRNCPEFDPPVWEFDAHVAPLGMMFYTGEMFPEQYRNQPFIALHGSWNRSSKIGYEVVVVHLDDSGRAIAESKFLSGLLRGEEDVVGRPVDVLQLHDGSVLVSDDHGGKNLSNNLWEMSYLEELRSKVQKGKDVFIADNATVIGDVILQTKVSVWYNAVIRGDKYRIIIGEGSNIQDGVIMHTDPGIELRVGNRVTVGHGAILHGCQIG